jgi:hypothetical protein
VPFDLEICQQNLIMIYALLNCRLFKMSKRTLHTYCYLFFDPGKPEKIGSTVFAKDGYTNWKKAKGNFNGYSTCKTHNNARLKCDE